VFDTHSTLISFTSDVRTLIRSIRHRLITKLIA
jgi:hypothetical protein